MTGLNSLVGAFAIERPCLAGRLSLVALLGVTSLTAPWLVDAAAAQDQSGATASNEIIVTAQRRSEALEDVPMSVAVISQQIMESSGVASLRDLAQVTTGFQLAQGAAYPQPAVRGVSTIINGTYENNVAVYIDGFYQTAPQAISIDLPNITSVEVLKGLQGTLYGRNATGGAVLLNTISPGNEWEGKAEATYARFNDRRLSAYLAGPVSDKIGISLAGYTRRGDGYVKLASRVAGGKPGGHAAPIAQDAIRAKLKLSLTETFTATLGYNYTHISDARADLLTALENIPPAVHAVAKDTLATRLGVAAYNFENKLFSSQHEGTLTLELNTGIGMLTSRTGYSQFTVTNIFDTDGSYSNGAYSTFTVRQKTFQQSIDYNINAINNLDLIVGGTYYNDLQRFIKPFNFYQGTANTIAEVPLAPPFYNLLFSQFYEEKKDAWAAFMDATFHVTDKLNINVGGRYSNEKLNPIREQKSAIAFLVRPLNAAEATFSKFTPRASIRYELAPRTNIYASYSKGFRSGAYPSSQPVIPTDWIPAKQETIDAYEAGFKSAQDGIRMELAGFYYDYKNLQISSTISGPSGNLITSLTNAPSAKIYGIEAAFEFQPIDNLTIRGGGLYLHARFGDNTIIDGLTVNPAALGLSQNGDPLKNYLNVNQTQNLSGLQLPRAPDYSANLGIDYLIAKGDGGLRLAANVKYTDDYVLTNPAIWCDVTASNAALCANIPADRRRKQRFLQSGYALVNASITWTDPSNHYYVRVWGNNLSDHRYRLHYTGNSANGTYSPMGEPLTFGATIGYKL